MAVQGAPKTLPVFFKHGNIIDKKDKPITVIEVCRAAEASVGLDMIEGAQKIQGLWRVYCLNEEARQKLISNKLSMRGISIDIYGENPFVRPPGENTYLAIHDIPLSYDNGVIKNWLETHGFPPVSPIKDQYARDENGKLTKFKTGSRFVFVDGDPAKIPEKAQIGLFTAKLWHPGMKKKATTAKCSNCLELGHTKTSCTNVVVCHSCKRPGHKKGECDLEALSSAELSDQRSHDTIQVDENVAKQVAAILQLSRSTPPSRGGRMRNGSHRTPRIKRTRSQTAREETTAKKKDTKLTPTLPSSQQSPVNEDWASDQTSDAESVTDTVRKKGTTD